MSESDGPLYLDAKKKYLGLFVEPDFIDVMDCVRLAFLGWGCYAVYTRDTIAVDPRTGDLRFITFDDSADEIKDWRKVKESTSGVECAVYAFVLAYKYQEAIDSVERGEG